MLLFFTVSYLFATFQEWYFHKYMHGSSGSTMQKNHQRHHTTIDLLYEPSSEDICFDIQNKTDIFQFLLVFTGNTAVLSFMFYPSISLITISITSSSLLTFYILVWNTLKCVPREYVPTVNWYSSCIIDNHQKHHLFPAGNFNIVFPGADYLFGTKIRTTSL